MEEQQARLEQQQQAAVAERLAAMRVECVPDKTCRVAYLRVRAQASSALQCQNDGGDTPQQASHPPPHPVTQVGEVVHAGLAARAAARHGEDEWHPATATIQ